MYHEHALIHDSVRREDLYDSSSSNSFSKLDTDTTSAQDALRQQLAALYGPIETLPPSSPSSPSALQPEAETEPEEEEEEFEFNLFAPSLPKSIPAPGDKDGMTIETPRKAQKIILEKDSGVDVPLGEGAIVRQRKDGWWMAEINEKRRAEYYDVAVSMDDIRQWPSIRHFGLEKPWKVQVIRTGLSDAQIAGAAKTALIAKKMEIGAEAIDSGDKGKSRTKPNKKRRIILRARDKTAREAAEAARVKAERDREAKLQGDADYAVKRNARNRERKIKRRERERRKKEAAKAGVDFVDEDSGDEVEEKKEVEVVGPDGLR